MNNLENRFWFKVDKGNPSDCWEWQGSRSQSGIGYGEFWIDGHIVQASRKAWEFTNGPIPEGKCVLHKCDNRGCVNPGHLFLGSQSENIIDMVKKGRCYNRKVTDETVRYIRESPQSSLIIGKELGLHAGHVRKIRLGKAASHVE